MTIPAWTDDAFYYHSIARNLASGNGFTADGLTTTTGFHPLWLMTLVPVAAACIQSKTAFIACSILLQGIFTAAGWMLLLGTLRHSLRSSSLGHKIVLVLIATLPVAFSTLLGGKESALAFLLIAAYVHLLKRSLIRMGKPSIASGIVLALCVLTRLDLGVLAVGIFVALSVNEPGKTFRNILLVLLPAGLSLLLWSVILVFIDGHTIPVSAFLKTRESLTFSPLYPILRLPLLYWMLPVGALFLLGLLFRRIRTRTPIENLQLLAAGLVFACMVQALIISVLQRCWLGQWYGISAFPAAVLLIVAIPGLHGKESLGKAVRVGFWILAAALAATWAFQFPQAIWFATQQHEHARSIATVSGWLESNAQKTDIAACSDSGRLGFSSEIPVVNLDGLANGYDYQDSLKRSGIQRYLADTGIRYFVLAWPEHLEIEDRRALIEGSYKKIEVTFRDKLPYSALGYPSDSVILFRRSEVMRHPPLGKYRFRSFIWDLGAPEARQAPPPAHPHAM